MQDIDETKHPLLIVLPEQACYILARQRLYNLGTS